MILQLSNITKSYAGNIILNKINIEVKKRDKIALVGRNGAGKSTVLKIITGEIDYDEGNIHRVRDLSIGYLAQHHDITSGKTIWEEVQSVFTHLIEEEKALEMLTEQISESSSNVRTNEKLIDEYTRRAEQFESLGGYRYKSDMKGVLTGLGFSEEQFHTPLATLSGGQKMRIALGKLLLTKPELLVLDEPTNHLDTDTLTWLESYLVNYDGALVIVSHDRYFLDKIVTKVYEISNQTATLYHGSYSDFLKLKRENYEQELKRYEQQQEEMKRAEEFIQRNIARASTTKRAQSKRRQLEKMTLIKRPMFDYMKASFSFDVAVPSGRNVISVEDFSYRYDDKAEPLFENVSFTIQRGERIALIGANGTGKTTLLKAIVRGDDEKIKLGSNVVIGYYAQEQENLNESNTILEEVWDAFPEKTEQEIRTVLGNFLFTKDEVLKQIQLLSGGEKARVSLAKLMLKKANFLILDEPTNHLDLVSKEVLESSLEHFPGTVLFVSHDRYFINKLADKVFELTNSGMNIYLGNYDYYLEKKEYEAQLNELKDTHEYEQKEALASETKKETQLSYHEQKQLQREQRKIAREIERVEKEIEQNEQLLEQLEVQMTEPNVLQDHEKLLALSQEADEIREKIDTLFAEWETLQSSMFE